MSRWWPIVTSFLALWFFAIPAAGFALTVDVLVRGVSYPWSLAFLPDGDYLITEKTGQLVRYDAETMERTEISGVPPVYYARQGGLLDVVLHPNFTDTRWVYLSYAHGSADRHATRVARGRLVGQALVDVEVLFDVTPQHSTAAHYGGRMAFLPDGTFLVTTGDGFRHMEKAQDLGTLMGKVVRLQDDGSIPVDNPFVGQAGVHPEIFTYGHRNPQGLAYDPVRDKIILHEHGPRGGDEINILEPGRNYGWPAITYGVDYSGAVISPYTHAPGMEQPFLHWTPSIAPSGLTVYHGPLFPKVWQGDYIVGALAGRHLRRVDVQDGHLVTQELYFEKNRIRIRDVRTGPDGAIYVLTDGASGELWRVSP